MTRNAYYVLSYVFGRKVKHVALCAGNMLLFTPPPPFYRNFTSATYSCYGASPLCAVESSLRHGLHCQFIARR